MLQDIDDKSVVTSVSSKSARSDFLLLGVDSFLDSKLGETNV